MKYTKRYKTIFGSLLFKLISSFMTVVIIFVVFQLSIHQLYIKSIDKEITANNISSLNHSMEKFSQIISSVQNTLMILYMSEDFYSIKNDPVINSFDAYITWKSINSSSLNKNSSDSFIWDIFVYRDDFDTIICSTGSYDKDVFFRLQYDSKKYPPSFWQELSGQNFKFLCLSTILPTEEISIPHVMPIIFKPLINNKYNLMLVAMVDIDNIVKFIDTTRSSDLYIYYKQELIFPEIPLKEINNSYIDNKSDYQKFDGYYLFKQFSSSNNISIIKLVSIKNLNKNLNKVNLLFFVFMFIAILFSILMSIVFSRKINNPVKSIVNYVKSKDQSKSFDSKITELDFINKSIHNYILQTDNYEQNISKNESLMKTFLSFAGIRNTHFDLNEIKETFFNKNNFRILSFLIHYKEGALSDNSEQNNATYFLLNYIQKLIEVYSKNCISIQVKSNKILLIISYDNESINFDELSTMILNKLENEKEYIYVTMCISNVYNSSSQLTQAFEETNNIFRWRKLTSNTQILTISDVSSNNHSFYISNSQESSFINHFMAGNPIECMSIIQNILDYNYKNEVRLFCFQKLGIHIVNLGLKCYNNLNLDIPKCISIDNIYCKINECNALEEFFVFYEDVINSFLEPIQKIKKTKTHNYIKDYVIDYIDNHYSEDIYLDLLSDKLKISSSYLSQYFKSRIGLNFVDYLNNIRIGKAKKFLLNTNKKIMDIANSVGYTNVNSFSRTFKKYTGTTPKEFRRNTT